MRRAAAALAAAAAVAAAGCGGPPVLDGPSFRDDFSADRGWPDGPRTRVGGGELVLRTLAPRETVFGALPAMRDPVRNLVVRARVRVAEGRVAGAGVTCRTGTDFRSPELYAFIVTADGAAQVLRADRRGIEVLAQGEVPRGGAAVRRGVLIEARCLRGELVLVVDGRELLRTSDRGVRTGRAGVLLLAGDDPRAEARIDDLQVRTGA